MEAAATMTPEFLIGTPGIAVGPFMRTWNTGPGEPLWGWDTRERHVVLSFSVASCL